MKIRKIFCILICSFLLSTVLVNNNALSNLTPPQNDSYSLKALTNSEAISIKYDANFTDYVFEGSGTEGDPYRIENLNIVTTEEYGIRVEKTTMHFVINNCYIEAEENGIYVFSVDPATATISNNECNKHTGNGIYTSNSQNTTLIHNKGRDNFRGAFISSCPYSTIHNNTYTDNSRGIEIWGSDFSNITENTINTCEGYGFWVSDCEYSNIINNTLTKGGIFIYEHGVVADYMTYTYSGNTINGLPFGFFGSENNLILDGDNSEDVYGQYLLVNCTNTIVRNMEIEDAFEAIGLYGCENLTVTQSSINNGLIRGLFIQYSTNISITHCEITNAMGYGIFSYGGSNITIEHNTIANNSMRGLCYRFSEFGRIANNVFEGDGLYIEGYSVDYYLNTIVESNMVNDKPVGYFINLNDLTFADSTYSQFIFVNCTNIDIQNQSMFNIDAAIYGYLCENVSITNCRFENLDYYGIRLISTDNVEILSNTFTNSLERFSYIESCNFVTHQFNIIDTVEDDVGSYAHVSNNATYTYNVFMNVAEEGLYLTAATQNATIHHNIFLNNNIEGSYWGTQQALDSGGTNNLWYDNITKEGNYWSDWSGTGNYSIQGSGNYADLYPLIDTDYDALPIEWEVEHNLNPWSDDTGDDADEDGLTNLEEYNLGLNPQSNDTDSDGMPDGWEVDNSLDPLADDAAYDTDIDGLTNVQEYQYNTNPLSNDTDGDSMPDGWEVFNSLDPLTDDANEDPDDDLLLNLLEYQYGTDPNNPDTDGDSYSDYIEIEKGTDPLDPNDYPKTSLALIIGLAIGGTILVATIIILKKKGKFPFKKNK